MEESIITKNYSALFKKRVQTPVFFSVGIGHKVDTKFVCCLSNLTFGKFDSVDKMSEMTDKVVDLLSYTLSYSLTNVSAHDID